MTDQVVLVEAIPDAQVSDDVIHQDGLVVGRLLRPSRQPQRTIVSLEGKKSRTVKTMLSYKGDFPAAIDLDKPEPWITYPQSVAKNPWPYPDGNTQNFGIVPGVYSSRGTGFDEFITHDVPREVIQLTYHVPKAKGSPV